MIKGIMALQKDDRKEIKTLDDKIKYIIGLTVRIDFTIFFLYNVYKL